MNNPEWFHFYAVEGDAQLKIVADLHGRREAVLKQQKKWWKSQGGIAMIRKGDTPLGILANKGAKVADGWKVANPEYLNFPPDIAYVPDNRKKAGKQLCQQLHGMVPESSVDLAHTLGAYRREIKSDGGGCYMVESQCYLRGRTMILQVPKNAKNSDIPEFPGCRPLKLSEFYAIGEAAGSEA